MTVKNPIFMIGMARSGTTAISEAITLHDDLGWFSIYLEHCPNRPWLAMLDRVCGIPWVGWYFRGKKSQEKGFTSFVRKYLPYPVEGYPVWVLCCGEKFSFDYLIRQTASEKEKRLIVNYIQTVLRFQGKKRFFAKFTGPARIHYLNSLFPDAYYVHIIRDPRAVVSSLMKSRFWREGGGLVRPWWHNGLTDKDLEEWEANGRSPVALGAVQWKRVVESTWEEKNLIPPDRYLEIRYEEFVEKPHGLLSVIFEKLALNDSVEAHRYISSTGKLRNMNYKYKKHLRANEIPLVERITWKTARRAGYDFGK